MSKNLEKSDTKAAIRAQIDGLKRSIGVAKDEELALLANVSTAALAKWIERGVIPRAALERIKKSKMSNTNSQTSEVNNAGAIVSIPFFPDTYAGAGIGIINYEDAVEIMTFSAEFLRGHLGVRSHKNLHIISAVGNSMEPLIRSGELLFVLPIENENGAISPGGVYVVSVGGDVLVKRIDRDIKAKAITLISENSTYPPRVLKDSDLEECRIIGRVVGHFDRI
jgi:phage repressor protein C with HTH and peptisase S24 domain